jgi:hypothetical protein
VSAPVAHRQPENNRGFDMGKVTISGKEYELKYTIESWKRLKEKHEITPLNFQDKINDDFASCISSLIMYGLAPSDREKVKVEDIDSSFGFEIMDVILPIIVDGMPKTTNVSRETDDDRKN